MNMLCAIFVFFKLKQVSHKCDFYIWVSENMMTDLHIMYYQFYYLYEQF